eukprot:10150940-Ditylum_brightwellii.AAC.1
MLPDQEKIEWRNWGLPNDKLSEENAVIISSLDEKIPFIIDPAEVSTQWLRKYLNNDKSRQ